MIRYILFFLSFVILSNTQAQKTLNFEKLSMEDGLSSGRANAIIQDNKGYIWIGTWNGLNCFDGYEFKKYIPDYRDSSTLPNREVVALIQDSKENIWIGTTSGLSCLNPRNDKITSYTFKNRILSLLEDPEGNIWIGTWGGGLHILNPESGVFERHFNNEVISDICEDTNNNFWLATYNGLIKYDRKNNSQKRYLNDALNPDNSLSNNTTTQVKKSKDGTIWVGTWGGGLNRLIYNTETKDYDFSHFIKSELPNSINSNVVYKLYIDQFSNIWCGSWDAGVALLEPEEQNLSPEEAKFYTYKNNINTPESISGDNISALFVDRSGLLWVGASEIDRTSIVKTGIKTVSTKTYEDNGNYYYRNVRAVIENKGHLWAGTSNELKLYKKNEDTYEFVKDIHNLSYTYSNYQYTSTSILDLACNNHGLWVATDDAGLVLFPKDNAITQNTPAFQYYNTETEVKIPGNKVNCIFTSKRNDNIIWIGTMHNGFAKLEYREGKPYTSIIQKGDSANDLSDNNIRAIFEDKNGFVWIGTQNGLNCYDPKTQKISKYFHSFKDSLSINDNVINSIFEDTNGNLWIGTNSGINKKINTKPGNRNYKTAFKNYPTSQRIGNGIITNILEDKNGFLWIKPYQGIVKFDPHNERIIKDYVTKDFQHLSIEGNSTYKSEDGTLIFGGTKGFIYFKPDQLVKNSFPPKPCITDFHIFNTSIHSPDYAYNTDSINFLVQYKNELKLSYQDKAINISFSAMDFKDPNRNNYAYFLEGYDEIWNETGNRNSATYTNIPPGEYTFHVKASNSDGAWSATPTSLKISISSPWWKTIWAYMIYAIVMIAVLYFFKEYSIIQIKEKSRIMLDAVKTEKENKLNELKTLFFTDITHEFRTPLTLIQGPAEELLNQTDNSPAVTKQAELILKNSSKLLKLVNQLMDFRKVDRGKMEMFLQNCNITGLLEELYDAFTKIATSRSIEFNIKLNKPNIEIYADVEKIERILNNLVSNAFKYTDDGGQINVVADIQHIDEHGECLIIEVEDDGIGIAEKHHDKVFERFFQTHQKTTHSTGGIGLYLSKTFAEQHGGFIELHSELGKGSVFKVIIPANLNMLNHPEENIEPGHIEPKPDKKPLIDKSVPEEDQKEVKLENKNLYKVLIVEDDHDLNEFIVSGLATDFETHSARNGKEGFEMTKSIDPDIIITDVMMPELNGFDFCKLLRKDVTTSHIPVIFLTAKTLIDHELKGLNLGAVDYIFKPFNLQSLKLRVHNILKSRNEIQSKIKKEILLEPEKIELSSLDEKLLKNAVEAVNKHLDDPTFDVEKFSEVIGLSANQAYRKIKALTGQTVKEFIRNQRLKTAASMLIQNKRAISEIIYMVGFSSPSYFSRCFKEFYHCTPKEYVGNKGKVPKK